MADKRLIRRQARDRSDPLPLARRKELTALSEKINELWRLAQKIEELGIILHTTRFNIQETKEIGTRIEVLSLKLQLLLSQTAHELQDIGAAIEPISTKK